MTELKTGARVIHLIAWMLLAVPVIYENQVAWANALTLIPYAVYLIVFFSYTVWLARRWFN